MKTTGHPLASQRMISHKSPPTSPQKLVRTALTRSRHAFAHVALFTMFINLLMLTGPLFMLQVYDRVLASKSHATLLALFGLVLMLFAFLGLLEFVRSRVLAGIAEKFSDSLNRPVFTATIDRAISNPATASTMPIRDVETIRQFIASPGPASLFDLPFAPLYIAVNFLLHPLLGYFSLAAAGFLIILSLLNEAFARQPMKNIAAATRDTHNAAEETLQNAEAIRAMRLEENLGNRWDGLQQTVTSAQRALSKRSAIFLATSKSSRMALQSAILAVGALLVIEQQITPGAMIAASIILARALAPIDQSIAHWRPFLTARAAFSRLKQAMADAPATPAPMQLPAAKGELRVENLHITAPSSRTPLLQGISFNLAPGEAMAILGPTGAGKSTLARALCGIHQPASGSVRLDGAALHQWPPAQLGPAIGYLPQSVELLSGTVRHNIARLEPSPDPAKITAAAQRADIHQLILAMPGGYDTEIGNDGQNLSSGQKQRIGLARALYNDPRLIILDEPNANLDAAGEDALTLAISNARQAGQTIIIVAHRPSAIEACNRVLYLRAGRQIAFGDRDEVLNKILARPVKNKSPQA